MKRGLLLTVRGKRDEWGFEFLGDPGNIADWQADGLDVVECEGRIPYWIAAIGLPIAAAAWLFLWRLLNWKNPFSE